MNGVIGGVVKTIVFDLDSGKSEEMDLQKGDSRGTRLKEGTQSQSTRSVALVI
jgi:hypothetical protein